jgi:hypothetical protein
MQFSSIGAQITPTRPHLPKALLGRNVLPKSLQALVTSEQGGEDRGIRKQYVSTSFTTWRHPEEHVEYAISHLREGVRV